MWGVDCYRYQAYGSEWLGKFLRKYKANAIRINTGAEMLLTGTTHRNALLKARQTTRENNITLILSSHADKGNYWDITWSEKAKVILNEDGLGDSWINNHCEVIRQFQPNAMEIMNEPPDATLSGNPNLTFARWRDFVIRAIEAYRTVKSDLLIMVDGCPFWNLNPWANTPLLYSDIYYVLHLHYFPDPTPPEPSWPEAAWYYGYYDAITPSDLQNAKNALWNYLLNNEGVSALFNKSLPILPIECGPYIDMPNGTVWLQDFYDFAKTYCKGFLQWSLASQVADPNPDKNGIIWDYINLELTPLGEVWARNMPTPRKHIFKQWQDGDTSPTKTVVI